jgi:hypothetical protein
MESRTSGFQYSESLNGRGNANTRGRTVDEDVTGLGTVAVKAVRVRLTAHGHTCPSVGYDADMGAADVRVGGREVAGQDGGEEFGRGDGVLFGEDCGGLVEVQEWSFGDGEAGIWERVEVGSWELGGEIGGSCGGGDRGGA